MKLHALAHRPGTWRGLRVAVKTLVVHDALLGPEGRRRQRAILEAAISSSLHHPNVSPRRRRAASRAF